MLAFAIHQVCQSPTNQRIVLQASNPGVPCVVVSDAPLAQLAGGTLTPPHRHSSLIFLLLQAIVPDTQLIPFACTREAGRVRFPDGALLYPGVCHLHVEDRNTDGLVAG